jgi:hypothetical protein
MTDLLDRVLSVGALRSVIRRKNGAGVCGQTISHLIAAYVSADAVAAAHKTRAGRLSVELIRPDLRVAFLDALQRVPITRAIVRGEIAPLRC